MALIDFQQEDTAPSCTDAEACSGLTGTQGPINQFAIQGGTAGTTEDVSGNFPNADTTIRRTVYYDLPIPSGADGAAGNWTVRINHTTGDASVLGREVHVCRSNSVCENQETLGSLTSQAFDTSTGVWIATVNQASSTTISADDRVFIVVAYENTAAHGNHSIGVTPDQIINSPWDDGVTGAAAGLRTLALTGAGI